MRYSYIFIIACSLSLVACNNAGTNNTTSTNSTVADKKETMSAIPAQSKLDATGTQLLVTVVNNYYSLKNAFVAGSATKADSAAIQVEHAADSLVAFLQKDSVNGKALKLYADTIIAQNQVLVSLQDKTCEQKRVPFGAISGAMYNLVMKAGLKNMNVFHDYCPMAFNEKGAYWLSDESEIKNPYFGKKMIECGEITDSLK